jgi:O-antigen/teichoic acid export membrane protein
MVGQELVGPVNRVALPDFSRQGTRLEIRERFDTMTGQVAILLAPLGAGVAACADILVPVLFGPSWVAASDVLWFLAWAALVAALASNIGIAFISLGGFRANTAIHAIGAVTLVPLLLVGAHMAGAKGAAAAVLVGNIVTVFASLIYSRWALDYGPLKFCYRIWRPIAAAIVMHLAITWLSSRLGDPQLAIADLVRLPLLVSAGVVIYPLLLLFLWVASGRPREAEILLVSVLVDKLKSRSQSRSNQSAAPPGD